MDTDALRAFADALKEKHELPGSGGPEAQITQILPSLLEAAGKGELLDIATQAEASLPDRGVRPDIAVYIHGLVCGYIEVKAPGRGADPAKFAGKHDREQWQRLKGLPNLIYTDGFEWALYRQGERPEGQPLIRLEGDILSKGGKAVSEGDADALGRLLVDFLKWQPQIPHSPKLLADYLAPLTHMLRSEVEGALAEEESAVNILAGNWRECFFPGANDAQFADAYAQTVTYAMLLARLSGAEELDPSSAAQALDKNNGVLAQALRLFGHERVQSEVRFIFELIQRSLKALKPHVLLKSNPDLWLYFYEDFLAAYDSDLRKDYGVYYTPREVVELQIRLADNLLEKKFSKTLGFADDGVTFLDPAVGTGTYPVAAVKHGLNKIRKRYGQAEVVSRAQRMAENIRGFEILIGPYAVAHLRLRKALEGAMNEGAGKGDPPLEIEGKLNIFLVDTLASPHARPDRLILDHIKLTEEHEAAQKIKNTGDILVCVGNPPYDRQTIGEGDAGKERKGGWVRFGGGHEGGQEDRPLLADFTDPVSKAGKGLYLKNIYNDYVYFWRWALWRMYEQQESGGIVTFITPSSYLSGEGFVGVREMMRRTFDELWIIDLEGDSRGARPTPNVFNIQTPVAIAIGARGADPSPDAPAKVRYAKIEAETSESKRARLEEISSFADIDWQDCPDDWHGKFLPVMTGGYYDYPLLGDVLPWQHSGVQFKRTWPIGETREVLESRWSDLCSTSSEAERKRKFVEKEQRKIGYACNDFSGSPLTPISELSKNDSMPKAQKYGFRPFDIHYALIDNRLCNRARPALLRAEGEANVYFMTLMTQKFGTGPAMIASAVIPDLGMFGLGGGRDAIPLHRDSAGMEPNIAGGLLDALAGEYGSAPTADDFGAYIYAILGGLSYTRHFREELAMPGPRVPVTKDEALFAEAARLGRRLIWLHTYAARFRGRGRGAQVPKGKAQCTKAVPSDPSRYPSEYSYDEDRKEIAVGEGRFGPVAPAVWNYEVSGLKVVQSWLGYRMRDRKGKKSSPLDDIRPKRWTLTAELLDLLWVLEATLAMEPKLAAVFARVVDGPCFAAGELPSPAAQERKEPRPPGNPRAQNGELPV